MTKEFRSCFVLVLGLLLLGAAATASSQEPVTIFDAVLGDTGESSPEISTRDLRRILMENSAVVFNARTFQEFAVSHIPGAINVSVKPGVSRSLYVSDVTEVGRRLNGNRTATIVLYCNGPYCGKVKRLATALQTAGYRNVRRYQLGMPVWRALGGVTEVEREGLKYVVSTDRTAVLIDVREPDAYREATLPHARNIPRSGVLEGKDVGEVRRAKDDGRLPMADHNTRILVVGRSGADARYVAEALTREAFHNVAYFAGAFEEARAVLEP